MTLAQTTGVFQLSSSILSADYFGIIYATDNSQLILAIHSVRVILKYMASLHYIAIHYVVCTLQILYIHCISYYCTSRLATVDIFPYLAVIVIYICDWICKKGPYTCNYRYLEIQL